MLDIDVHVGRRRSGVIIYDLHHQAWSATLAAGACLGKAIAFSKIMDAASCAYAVLTFSRLDDAEKNAFMLISVQHICACTLV